MAKSKYSRERLAPLVASSRSMSDVIRKLGLEPNGGNHRLISGRVRQAELDISHFGAKLRKRVEEIAEDELRVAIARTTSLAQVLRSFDLPDEGRAQDELKKRIARLTIDTSHHRGPGWSRGDTAETNEAVARGALKRRIPDDEVFVENSPVIGSGPALVKRLRAMGWTYSCSICGIAEWQAKALVLHLDHINGIANDNRLVNLRLLCPNCHSQTDTYCNKRRLPTRASEPRARYSCYTTVTRACRNW